MLFLCLQVVLFVAGAYALIAGKLPLTGDLKLEGRRARVTGALLLLPVGVPMIYGVVFIIIAIASGHPEDFRLRAGMLDIPITVGAIALSIICAYLTRPKHAPAG